MTYNNYRYNYCKIIGILDSLGWHRQYKKWGRTLVDLGVEIKKNIRGESKQTDFPEFENVHLHVTVSLTTILKLFFSKLISFWTWNNLRSVFLLPVTSVLVSVSGPPLGSILRTWPTYETPVRCSSTFPPFFYL